MPETTTTKTCAPCAGRRPKRDRAVYRCIRCNRLLCEHLIGAKRDDPERPGRVAGVCASCRLTDGRSTESELLNIDTGNTRALDAE